MNFTWVILGVIISSVGILITGLGWNWDKWYKKADNTPKKMEQAIKDSPNTTAYQAGRDLEIK